MLVTNSKDKQLHSGKTSNSSNASNCCNSRISMDASNNKSNKEHTSNSIEARSIREPARQGLQQQQGLQQRYTHKTSGYKTSGFITSGFKTSETSGLQNVRFTKCQVYKTSGLQNVRPCKKHLCIFCTCGWWKSAGSVAAMFAGKVIAVFYSLF